MNRWIARGAQVGVLSAGLIVGGGAAACAAPLAYSPGADTAGARHAEGGNVVGNGGHGGAGIYNAPGSVSLVNLGFGGRGGDGGTDNSSDGSGDVVGTGGDGGPGVYNAPGSYSLVNVSIDGEPGKAAPNRGSGLLSTGSITGGQFLTLPVSRRAGPL